MKNTYPNKNSATIGTVETTPDLAVSPTTHTTPTGVAQGSTPETFSGNRDGTPSEQLAYFEQVVSQSLDREDRVAEAIAEIKVRKLYKITGQSFGAYVQTRWKLSRSRAYQLIRYARLKQQAEAAGKTPPTSERAARHLDAEGNSSQPGDSYVKVLVKGKRQIKEQLAKLPPGEHRKYIDDMRIILNDLEKTLGGTSPQTNPQPLPPQNSLPGGFPEKLVGAGEHPVLAVTSQLPIVLGGDGGRIPVASTAVAPSATTAAIKVQSNPVGGYSIEEARAKGFLKAR